MVASIIVLGSFYLLILQNPLFMADIFSRPSSTVEKVEVKPYIQTNPSSPWAIAKLSYECDNSGPGFLQITNNEQAPVTIVSIALSYNGVTYMASGPSCTADPGNSVISITALGAPPGGEYSPYRGYLETSEGVQIQFSGFWG